MFFGLSLLILGLSQVNCIQVDNLEVAIDRSTGSYQIFLSNNLWLNSGPVYVRNDGATLSSENHTLILRGVDSTWDITDEWGHFRTETFHWKTLDESFSFDTYMNIYTDIPVVVFGQLFVDGAAKTALPDTSSAISSFPTFLVQDTGVERGYLTYAGGQLSKTIVGRWTPEDNIFHGVDGGFPIALFDHKKRYILEIFMQNALVMSPLNTFMSAATTSWLVDDETPALGFGIISTVDKIPKGYAYETILVAGQNVTGTMDSWGELLRSKYKKDDSFRKRDYSINYLGYWTDNGACYYYYTGDYANYEDALVAVKEDADRQGIPFRYLQLDSWWYFKDDKGGVKNWTAMPDVFPNGIEAVVKKTGWPIVAHNRFWSSQAVYAQRNGGLFDFIIDDADDIALPNDPKFWPYLLSNAQQQWNLWVYEQDWLFTEFSTLRELQTELNLGYVWLKQMGDAAQDLDLTIQYCMSWTRHALQSVEISTVTQIRVSGDYHPGNDQWMIGDSTILAHSLGLAAFKDNFHTTSTQAKCKFTDKEPNPVLETYIAALSGGPVGPSDAVGGANKTLIMATCMADGRLLKPTRPAMSLDKSFIYRAFGVGDIDGEVYSAYSEVFMKKLTHYTHLAYAPIYYMKSCLILLIHMHVYITLTYILSGMLYISLCI